MATPIYRKKTREELISAFKQAINRKKAWEEDALKEFAEMSKRQIVI